MSVRHVLELCCDDCGILVRFETLRLGEDTAGVMTLNPSQMASDHGWKKKPIDGLNLRRHDICPNCFELHYPRRS